MTICAAEGGPRPSNLLESPTEASGAQVVPERRREVKNRREKMTYDAERSRRVRGEDRLFLCSTTRGCGVELGRRTGANGPRRARATAIGRERAVDFDLL
jgi:hypothetical protein